MIDLVFTVMISALSLAQPGQGAITTNELPPPPGMSAPAAQTNAPSKPGTQSKTNPVAASKSAADKAPRSPETRSQASVGNGDALVVENAQPAGDSAAPAPVSTGSEAAQPTREEIQAPTQKQASGSESPGRVAAFWFILPNRPTGNK